MAVVHCFLLPRGRVQHISSRGSAALRVSEQSSENRADRHALSDWSRTFDCEPETGRTSPTDSGRPALVGGRAGLAVADLPGMDRTVRVRMRLPGSIHHRVTETQRNIKHFSVTL